MLLSLCRPGKQYRYGMYALYAPSLAPRVPHDLLDENLLVLYSVVPKLMGRRPYVLVFTVSRGAPEHPFEVDLPNIDGCGPGVCVDGLNVPIGDYKSYVFSEFAMYLRGSGDVYTGVLLSYRPIRVPGALARARNRLRMWRLSRRTRRGDRGGGAG